MNKLVTLLALWSATVSANAAFAEGNLWAGNVIGVEERETVDPCHNGDGWDMNRGDYGYGSWARQRAAYTNICFEIWMPGVTDQENPDYWRLLDVQVHYRYEGQGDYNTEYVASIDRRGNNRRYVWDLRLHDPFPVSTAPATIPYREKHRHTDDDGTTWASVESMMEFYFTVNGRELKKPDGWPFYVLYGDATVILP